MITVFGAENTVYKGLSADLKPVKARNGDRFIEIDSKTLFLFDEENMAWMPINTDFDPTSNLVGFGKVGYMIVG